MDGFDSSRKKKLRGDDAENKTETQSAGRNYRQRGTYLEVCRANMKNLAKCSQLMLKVMD